MRALFVVLAVLLASCATSLAVWAAVERSGASWCEVVDCRLLRTTATEAQINQAVAEVMAEERPLFDVEGGLDRSEYREKASSWFKQDGLLGYAKQRLSGLMREELDQAGCLLRVNTLHGPEMPSLVFVEHDLPTAESTVAKRIAERLARVGVATR